MELEHFGNPEVSREADNLGMAKLFKEHLLEQMRRVLQPPKCERALAFPAFCGIPLRRKKKPT